MNPSFTSAGCSINRIASYIDDLFSKNNIIASFPEGIALREFDDSYSAKEKGRCDLTALRCLTIDCEDTKDMDDAVSIERKRDGGYILGVHIADVGHFIEPDSDLDMIAMDRGTSIYLPDRTIPMLPSALSDDLCSLNPGVPRRTVSVIVDMDTEANVVSYKVCKSLICSQIKGTYDEVNRVIAGKQTHAEKRKYKKLIASIYDMRSLAKRLQQKREALGAKPADAGALRAKIDGTSVNLVYKEKGMAEAIIQEFMVLANLLMAKYFVEKGLPTIQRVLSASGTMAFYSDYERGHADLAAEDYMHFTSPIRRLSDLKVHQILSACLAGESPESIRMKFVPLLPEVCEIATKRMRRAKSVERAALRVCEEEYFKANPKKRYTGVMVGYDRNHRPLFELDELHVRIPSLSSKVATIGEKFAFNVGIGRYTEKLGCFRLHPVSA